MAAFIFAAGCVGVAAVGGASWMGMGSLSSSLCFDSASWRLPMFPAAWLSHASWGSQFDIMSTSFFLSRRALKQAAHSAMPRWQERLFLLLARSGSDATDFFHIPTGRVVEVGTQVTV
jgi:K+ potassium transporter C-terminal domain